MNPQLKLTPRTTTSLKTTLIKYAAVVGVITAVAFISVFLINYFGATKDALADNKGETTVEIGSTVAGPVRSIIDRYYDNSVYEVIYLQSEIANQGDITKLALDKYSGNNNTEIN
ncbi:MAG: hypothetical protein K9J13_05680, partial [Saprospiraceae bacterium]|nr:hypothetical protein [Saprospiraceae bacterium]